MTIRLHSSKGFTVVEVLMVLLAIPVVVIAGIFILRSSISNSSSNNPSMTFEQCKKIPGSKLLTSYPEQCVTADGQSFANPDQGPDKPIKPETSTPDSKTSEQLYDECATASGSRILMTYPEQCVTADGKTYTRIRVQ